jgi:hypothetical protein
VASLQISSHPHRNRDESGAAGKARDLRPIAASHVAPGPQPTAKPTIAGHVRMARSHAFATTVESNFALSELSANDVRNRGVRGSTISDMCQTVLCGATLWRRPMPGLPHDHGACPPVYL